MYSRLHFHLTQLLAGCLSLLLLICTWWYLCWQVGVKVRCGGNPSVKGSCYEPAPSAQLGSTCWKIKWSCLLYLFLECNWKELFLFLRHRFLVFCHPWTIMTMQTITDNWRISPWRPSLTASLSPQGLRLQCRQQILIANISSVWSDAAAVLYVPPKETAALWFVHLILVLQQL